MHLVSGRWRLGLALSLCTALLWGVLPIALVAVCAYRTKVAWIEYFHERDEARLSRDPIWDLSLDWSPLSTPLDEQ